MPHGRLIGFLSYLALALLFPLLTASVVGLVSHSATLGIKTFLLIELGMAILSPLLNAVLLSTRRRAHHHCGRS